MVKEDGILFDVRYSVGEMNDGTSFECSRNNVTTF